MSISESGHATNAQNFNNLITVCTSFGGDYAPARTDLTIPNLQTQISAVQLVLIAVTSKFALWKNAIAEREILFTPLSDLVARILAVVRAFDIPAQEVDNILTLVRKINGQRAKALKAPVPDDPNTPENEATRVNSVSQMSFNSRLANFQSLISMLSEFTNYVPTENDLQVANLQTLHDLLAAKNNEVVTLAVALKGIRIARNNAMYAAGTGLVDIATAVKNYVKGIFGNSSPQYKQVFDIKFKTIK